MRVLLDLETHWNEQRPVRAKVVIAADDERSPCTGALNCACHVCCPDAPAMLIFFHCSGRVRSRQCPPGSATAVLDEAHDFVARSVGGARHHVLRMAKEEVLYSDSTPVAPEELLVVVLHGLNFHLSPLCEGDISAQWPLPEYASQWVEMPTTEATSLAAYVAADRGRTSHDAQPPPLPSELYSMAFRLRHGGLPVGDRRAANGLGLASIEASADAPASAVHEPEQVPAPPLPEPTKGSPGLGTKRKSSRRRSELPPTPGMCGYSSTECALLLAAGKKPWDEDAEEVLNELRRASSGGGTLV